jgi:hypothetical protein
MSETQAQQNLTDRQLLDAFLEHIPENVYFKDHFSAS